MRLVLALEASSRTYAVAAGDEEVPRVRRESRRDDPAFAGLGDLVAQALAAAGATFSDIGAIAVDVGPGGLSSIRAAVAYANGLAFSLGVRVFPITSLELMALAAVPARRGPLLCLKRGTGGNTYGALFVDGEVTEMRYGPAGSIVPDLAAGLAEVCVAGLPEDEVARLLPGVTIRDTGIANADVTVLYQTARAALADPERLVTAATAVNEGSPMFHRPVTSARPHPGHANPS
jgi:tRNA threonylcarbamoyl adenosine modification protein YeaZ